MCLAGGVTSAHGAPAPAAAGESIDAHFQVCMYVHFQVSVICRPNGAVRITEPCFVKAHVFCYIVVDEVPLSSGLLIPYHMKLMSQIFFGFFPPLAALPYVPTYLPTWIPWLAVKRQLRHITWA